MRLRKGKPRSQKKPLCRKAHALRLKVADDFWFFLPLGSAAHASGASRSRASLALLRRHPFDGAAWMIRIEPAIYHALSIARDMTWRPSRTLLLVTFFVLHLQ